MSAIRVGPTRTKVTAGRRVDAELRQIAQESGIDYFRARTNLREVFGKQVSWGFLTHGSVLASIGLVLSPVIESLRIPSTHLIGTDIAWGSHPSLDPLWSTDRLTVIHDGADASRVEKTRRVADEPLAQEHLRVCFMQFRRLNCSRCVKCMRTMATLTFLNRLDAFPTFRGPVDLDRLQAKELRTPNDVIQMKDVLALGATVAGHDDLKDAIQSMLTAYQDKLTAKQDKRSTSVRISSVSPLSWREGIGPQRGPKGSFQLVNAAHRTRQHAVVPS